MKCPTCKTKVLHFETTPENVDLFICPGCGREWAEPELNDFWDWQDDLDDFDDPDETLLLGQA